MNRALTLHFNVCNILAPKSKTNGGGDVWVLLITDTKPTDTDLYICEVNSNPPIKSFHSLKGDIYAHINSKHVHV